jgi:ribosomal protein S18 acetylase RimI-like enzyme
MLTIRPFQRNRDEEAYARVFNASFSDYDDMRRLTVEEVKVIENAPSGFNFDGLLLAEWNDQTVGMIQARVDEHREEKKGFISYLAVLPDFRRKGFARRLLSAAIESLKNRGMETATAWAETDRTVCIHIYESHGFKRIRTHSLMKRNLSGDTFGTTGGSSLKLRETRISDDKEIAIINQLDNEAFKEHFNYRPMTFDETKYLMVETPLYQKQKAWFALVDNQPVGYVVASIDERLNREKNAHYGWISNIGVLKPYRRMKLGTALMYEAMSYLKAQKMEDALLYVDDQNPTKAIRLYEQVGFEIYRTNVAYERNIT